MMVEAAGMVQPQAKEYGQHLGDEQGKEQLLPWSLQEELNSAGTLILAT